MKIYNFCDFRSTIVYFKKKGLTFFNNNYVSVIVICYDSINALLIWVIRYQNISPHGVAWIS